MKRYEEYQMLAPVNLKKPIYMLVSMSVLRVMALQANCSLSEIKDLTEDQFIDTLCQIHEAVTLDEAERRLREISMKSDDMALVTFEEYVADWNFEMKCIGDKMTIPKKILTNCFINGLRPVQLQKVVRKHDPKGVSKCTEIVNLQLRNLRIGRENAKLFGSFEEDSSKSKHQNPKNPKFLDKAKGYSINKAKVLIL